MWKCSSNDVTRVITPRWLCKGVVHDYKKTFEWHFKSANNEYANGQYNVRECYYYGRGVTQD